MRFFVWVDFQFEMIALFLGAVFLILTYLAWASYPRNRAAGTKAKSGQEGAHEGETGFSYENMPVPPFLILIYIGFALLTVSYFIFMWASKGR